MTEPVAPLPEVTVGAASGNAAEGDAVSAEDGAHSAVTAQIEISQSFAPGEAQGLETLAGSMALRSGTVPAVERLSLQLVLPEAQLARLLGAVGQYQYRVESLDSAGLLSIEGDAEAMRALLAALPDYLSGDRQGIVLRDGESAIIGRYIFEPESGHLVRLNTEAISGGSSMILGRLPGLTPTTSLSKQTQNPEALSANADIGGSDETITGNLFSSTSSAILLQQVQNTTVSSSPAATMPVLTTQSGGNGIISRGADPVVSHPSDTVVVPVTGSGSAPNVAPVALDVTFALDENSANGTVVGVVTATDANPGDILNYVITAGNASGAFAINAATGQITVADVTQLDFETRPTFNLTITVTDNAGTPLSDAAAVTINLNDVAETVSTLLTAAANDNPALATGNDTVTATDSAHWQITDTITGGTGTDRLVIAAGAAVTVNLADGQWENVSSVEVFDLQADAAHSLTLNDEYFVRGAGVNTTAVTVDASTLTTGIFVDNRPVTNAAYAINVTGGSGDDEFRGGLSNDAFTGAGGADFMNGGDGADTIYGGTGSDTVTGQSGSDLIYGGADDDELAGGTEADTIDGGSGADTIDGEAGDDSLLGGAGSDTLIGGSGADTIDGGTEADRILGDAGADSLVGNAGADTIYGGSEDDTVRGGADADSLFGDAGADLVFGDAGADTIDGGAGVDTLTGGTEADSFYFSNLTHSVDGASDLITDWDTGGGADIIDLSALGITGIGAGAAEVTISNDGTYTYVNHNSTTFLVTLTGVHALIAGDFVFSPIAPDFMGTSDDDTLTGTAADEGFMGLAGDDSINGGGGDDTVYGGDGADTVTHTGNDDDITYGGNGDDVISDSQGSDTVYGGDGADSIYVNSNGFDNVYGGDGADTLTANFNGFRYGSGGEGDDVITGSDGFGSSIYIGYDLIYGDAGNDSIDGRKGRDTIYGGAGSDTITGGQDADAFHYTADSDSPTATPDRITDFEQGVDRIGLLGMGYTGIAAGAAVGTVLGYTTGGGLTTITNSAGTFTLVFTGIYALTDDDFMFGAALTGTAGNDTLGGAGFGIQINADDGNDSLTGTAGADEINGGNGDDTISAGDGNDYIIGYGGADSINGGAGNDFIDSDFETDNLAGSEDNTVHGGDGDDSIFSDRGNDLIYGDNGNDYIDIGGYGADAIYGGNGADTIMATGDNGTIVYGGSDNDIIIASGANRSGSFYGDDGADSISAGDGADTLDGGAGQDTLTGGGADADQDRFVFTDATHSTNVAADLITDFENGVDKIVLTGLGFTAITDFETLSFGGGITTLGDAGTNFTITFTGDYTALLDNTDFIW